ncbi:DUF4118 domain-containing protein [Methylotenera sp.]|uniref:DUF4118 domain-containing protein n=1 Tax=Methylotenera sp. TaxID=2051956 RepID=UPI0025FA8E32|nr:DUF4118 domain-containing protein [uncultured Methylotenera sp.]
MQNNNKFGSYILAILILTLIALGSAPLYQLLDLANIVMIFLLAVFLIAFKLGRGPAILSAIFAVALFDFFFVPPRFSFQVHDLQYVVTFLVMLCVSLITAHLTAMLQQKSEEAIKREHDTNSLYKLARELAGATTHKFISEAVKKYLSGIGFQSALHAIDIHGNFPSLKYEVLVHDLALSAIQQSSTVNISQLSSNNTQGFIVPIKSTQKAFGVLMVQGDMSENSEQVNIRLLVAISDLVSITMERLHYVELVQETQLEAASERLRGSILSALSHDLRTPLTGLVGMSDSLAILTKAKDIKIHDAASAICDQARTMNNLLSNLLDMARLHAGKIELQKEWQLFEDVIGASIQLLKPALTNHRIAVQLEPNLPLVNFDAVLIERVLCNLIENASKYSPAGTIIEIRCFVDSGAACISVSDHGAGFPDDQNTLLQMFTRGDTESNLPGVGMGLAICKAIMDAHQGTVEINSSKDDGAIVTITFPIGTPPEFKPETESEE